MFPPTLIQFGTKEVLLSDSVRLHLALDQAGIPVKLDVYEMMPHVFQFSLHNIPNNNSSSGMTEHDVKELIKQYNNSKSLLKQAKGRQMQDMLRRFGIGQCPSTSVY
jgi:acetyl esterase/lipase